MITSIITFLILETVQDANPPNLTDTTDTVVVTGTKAKPPEDGASPVEITVLLEPERPKSLSNFIRYKDQEDARPEIHRALKRYLRDYPRATRRLFCVHKNETRPAVLKVIKRKCWNHATSKAAENGDLRHNIKPRQIYAPDILYAPDLGGVAFYRATRGCGYEFQVYKKEERRWKKADTFYGNWTDPGLCDQF